MHLTTTQDTWNTSQLYTTYLNFLSAQNGHSVQQHIGRFDAETVEVCSKMLRVRVLIDYTDSRREHQRVLDAKSVKQQYCNLLNYHHQLTETYARSKLLKSINATSTLVKSIKTSSRKKDLYHRFLHFCFPPIRKWILFPFHFQSLFPWATSLLLPDQILLVFPATVWGGADVGWAAVDLARSAASKCACSLVKSICHFAFASWLARRTLQHDSRLCCQHNASQCTLQRTLQRTCWLRVDVTARQTHAETTRERPTAGRKKKSQILSNDSYHSVRHCTHCNIVQYTATHRNAPWHTATHSWMTLTNE